MRKLKLSFYKRDTIEVAKDLLGKYLVHVTQGTVRIGKIVEVEAYLGPKDLAAHSSKGLTKRTEVLFGPAGCAYVYLVYGMYYCINAVTEDPGCAVLIRAIEPIQHVDGRSQGPGLVCRSLHIDKRLNGHSLLSDDLYIASPDVKESFTIIKKPRIGVDYAAHWAKRLLRFYIKDNPFVSKR